MFSRSAFQFTRMAPSAVKAPLRNTKMLRSVGACVTVAGAGTAWVSCQSNAKESKQDDNVVLVESRATRRLFTIIRDKNTENEEYVRYCDRLLAILAEEGIAHLSTVKEGTVETPCGSYKGLLGPSYRDICAVSIMRSGDILLDAVRKVAPGIAVGKILIQRDEAHPEKIAKLFYSKLPPNIASMQVIMVDPMLATGGSAVAAAQVLTNAGVKEENIMFLNVVAAPEGIAALSKTYPKIKIVTAAIDDGLNSHKYIVPGLGDFGDRYYRS